MDFLRTRPGRQTSVCSLMVAICSCFYFSFLRVALLLLEGCLGLQPELGVTRYWIFGLHIGSRVDFGQYNHRVIEHHIACFGPMDFI